MKLADFSFDLPESLIAVAPVEPRDGSRLLVVDRAAGTWQHRHFHELPEFLAPNDLLVLNNTRVIPARLFARDATDRHVEVFLLSPTADPRTWNCLVKPGRRVKEGLDIIFSDGQRAHLSREGQDFRIAFENLDGDFFAWLEKHGKTPLPPYIKREATAQDRARYQTVYAKDPGSVAAPTAGLHFTPELLHRLRARNQPSVELTLHVGYGTFAPIHVEKPLEDHRMHEERYQVPESLVSQIEETRRKGARVVPVGTTSLRTLESLEPGVTSGATSIFIKPGYKFRHTDALITNFHLPESSLFVLICALMGTELAQACYREAIRERYRFYSYGDAMLVL